MSLKDVCSINASKTMNGTINHFKISVTISRIKMCQQETTEFFPVTCILKQYKVKYFVHIIRKWCND